jgi:hypothetical protein
MIVGLISKDKCLNDLDLLKIVSMKASLNKGLPSKLKEYFPNVMGIEKSEVNIPANIDPN